MNSKKHRVNNFLLLLLNLTSFLGYSQIKIIKSGDEWSYYDKKEAPKKGWENSTKITSSWETGISGLGYGDRAVSTIIDYGKNPKKKILTAYFSKTFQIKDPFEFILYQIKLEKDDGIVLYLNGNEIFREDMPSGKINHNTRASKLIVCGKQEDYLHTIFLSPEDLLPGKNIISASVHQGLESSIDLIFNLELSGHNDLSSLQFLEKKRTIKNLHFDLKLKDLICKQEIEKKTLQHQLLHQKLQQRINNSKTYSLIFLFLFISSISGLGYLFFIYKTKTKEIQSINEILKKQNQAKDSEMMNISLNSLNSKQLLKTIKKELEESIKEINLPVVKKETQKIIKNIDYNIDSSEDWDNLKKHFNVVHSGYVDKLSELHPSLSEIELRHCIFIKLHMQTKEIANILHIDPRSVQTSRYRIKKKMNLDENTNLKEYLLSIS